MLKAQDCLLLIKLLANPTKTWLQRELAQALQISLSEVNSGIKRLTIAGLIRTTDSGADVVPIISAAEEFLIHALKYFFPAKLGSVTRGIPTSTGASLFKDKIALDYDLIPVWPDANGDHKGVALEPIHPAVTRALRLTPDMVFYELLVLVDTIRQGRPRERNLAIELLKKRLTHE